MDWMAALHGKDLHFYEMSKTRLSTKWHTECWSVKAVIHWLACYTCWTFDGDQIDYKKTHFTVNSDAKSAVETWM